MISQNKMVYILILNWNGWKDTVECVESCLKLTYPDHRIIIIDNGSSDDSETILRKHFPKIQFIQTGENLGFAGGNNVGIKYAMEHGADYVWLLNNDTVVAPDALYEMVSVAESDKLAGIVGSKIYYYNEPNKLWFAGGIWKNNRSFATHRGHDEYDQGQYNDICEVDYITGCSLLIKSSVINSVGLMDEDFFLYWEDTDWNASVSKKGWTILYVPMSHVWHKVSSSAQSVNVELYDKQIYYYIRNSLLFFQKHEPKRLLILFIHIIGSAITLYKSGKKDVAKGYLYGLKDFAIRRFRRIN